MLAVVGDLVEDIVVWHHGPIEIGTDNAVDIFKTRGGSAANVAAFAASAYPTRFIGSVGADATGEHLVRQLEAQGVEVRVQHNGDTGTIIILIDAEGERTMMPSRGAATELKNVDRQWLDGVELLHVPAYSFFGEPIRSSVERLIAALHAKGGRLSIDASSTQVLEQFGAQAFLTYAASLRPTFLIANDDEAAALGMNDPSTRTAAVERLPETTFVLKAGSGPTRVLRAGQDELVVPVPPVSVVRDSTGAGDAFAAGFLTTYLTTADLRSAVEGGHARAASVLAQPGATASIQIIPTAENH